MQEDFLHYLWKFKKFDHKDIKTTSNLSLSIITYGEHNLNSGPDFFNAKIKIGDQIWAGNVEIHLKASDWYVHRHEIDSAYDNVILHVVWEEDIEIFRKDNSNIPTLVLKQLVDQNAISSYKDLLQQGSSRWINCERDFGDFDGFIVENWLERVYFERLQSKSLKILELLKRSENNWEEVFYKVLLKSFGSKVNGDAFESIADNTQFNLIRKIGKSPLQLEAMLFGQARLLDDPIIEDIYYRSLQQEYTYLKQKYRLENSHIQPPKYFRLRPDNFPNIRLSQFATLYSSNSQLFSKIIQSNSKEEIYDLLNTETSEFWNTHYTFSKTHKRRSKKLSRNFLDLIIINTIVPLKFCYLQTIGDFDESNILGIIQDLLPETNSIIDRYEKLRPNTAKNAMLSQGLLQLKQEYCDKNACLKCALGSKLIQGLV
tara:strand:- start:13463 stop:14749 length:1287 start_codon:yes stop_codon:yes gene_type:complete